MIHAIVRPEEGMFNEWFELPYPKAIGYRCGTLLYWYLCHSALFGSLQPQYSGQGLNDETDRGQKMYDSTYIF